MVYLQQRWLMKEYPSAMISSLKCSLKSRKKYNKHILMIFISKQALPLLKLLVKKKEKIYVSCNTKNILPIRSFLEKGLIRLIKLILQKLKLLKRLSQFLIGVARLDIMKTNTRQIRRLIPLRLMRSLRKHYVRFYLMNQKVKIYS